MTRSRSFSLATFSAALRLAAPPLGLIVRDRRSSSEIRMRAYRALACLTIGCWGRESISARDAAKSCYQRFGTPYVLSYGHTIVGPRRQPHSIGKPWIVDQLWTTRQIGAESDFRTKQGVSWCEVEVPSLDRGQRLQISSV